MTFDNDMMFAHYDLLGLLLVFALLLVNPFLPFLFGQKSNSDLIGPNYQAFIESFDLCIPIMLDDNYL